MWNAGDTPARMIEIITPPGLEGSFHEMMALLEAGTRTKSRYHGPCAQPTFA